MLSILLTLGICQHLFVSGCLFKSSVDNSSGYWGMKEYHRQVFPPGCACGIQGSSETPPWILYLHSQTSPSPSPKVCTATVLTSNLVATSHKCLVLQNHSIHVYDTWNPHPKWTAEGKNVVNPEMVYLSTSKSKNTSKVNKYQVKDIILNTRYALSTASTKHGVVEEEELADLALLVVNENLFQQGHSAICLPSWKEAKSLDVVHQLGFYSDIVESNKSVENLVILKRKECNVDVKQNASIKSGDDSYCLRYIGSWKYTIALNEGGPLTVKSTSGSAASFMVGVANRVDHQHRTTGYTYSYFNNILPLVKYIEHHAAKAKSSWCTPPKSLKLGSKVKPSAASKYAWKDYKPKDRDESLDCTCGIRNNASIPSGSPQGRIAGGVEAEPFEFPWMIILDFAFAEKKWYLCGGSIVNDRIVLTAAHCVVKFKQDREILTTEIHAYVNKHAVANKRYQSKLEVEAIYYHPDYAKIKESGQTDADIALMVLKEPLKFSSRKDTGGIKDLRPVCLPKMSNLRIPQVGENSIVSGWGLTNPDDTSSRADKLQKVDVPILSREQCQDASSLVNENMICAGYLNRSKDSAKGDSGGPQMLLWDGQLVQIGVVSFGHDFHDNPKNLTEITSTLAVYTNVQKFVDFVEFYSELEGAKWCKPAV